MNQTQSNPPPKTQNLNASYSQRIDQPQHFSSKLQVVQTYNVNDRNKQKYLKRASQATKHSSNKSGAMKKKDSSAMHHGSSLYSTNAPNSSSQNSFIGGSLHY